MPGRRGHGLPRHILLGLDQLRELQDELRRPGDMPTDGFRQEVLVVGVLQPCGNKINPKQLRSTYRRLVATSCDEQLYEHSSVLRLVEAAHVHLFAVVKRVLLS